MSVIMRPKGVTCTCTCGSCTCTGGSCTCTGGGGVCGGGECGGVCSCICG